MDTCEIEHANQTQHMKNCCMQAQCLQHTTLTMKTFAGSLKLYALSRYGAKCKICGMPPGQNNMKSVQLSMLFEHSPLLLHTDDCY